MDYTAELYIIKEDGTEYVSEPFTLYYYQLLDDKIKSNREKSALLVLQDIVQHIVFFSSRANSNIKDIIINDISDENNPVPVVSYSEWFDKFPKANTVYTFNDGKTPCFYSSIFLILSRNNHLNFCINRDIIPIPRAGSYYDDYFDVRIFGKYYTLVGKHSQYILSASSFFHDCKIDVLNKFLFK